MRVARNWDRIELIRGEEEGEENATRSVFNGWDF
jgi:hypothetical protein